jgi:6,7-dimethyl-8-ribityllumazine synthase
MDITAGNFRYAVVAARFNHAIVDELLKAALETLAAHSAPEHNTTVMRVPGAFEIPLACQKLAAAGRYDAIIALGCVIRGETPHFDYVCAESARGIMDVSLKFDLPVVYGIVTADNTAQAEARARPDGGDNKGADAARAAMEMLGTFRSSGL